MHHHTVEISINFINTYQVRRPAKVQGNVGQTAAVVDNKAFTVLPDGNFFNKFGISICKPRNAFFA
jgi:hypothetical protein